MKTKEEILKEVLKEVQEEGKASIEEYDKEMLQFSEIDIGGFLKTAIALTEQAERKRILELEEHIKRGDVLIRDYREQITKLNYKIKALRKEVKNEN